MKRSVSGYARTRALPLGLLAAAAATFLAISPVMADTTLNYTIRFSTGTEIYPIPARCGWATM